MSFGRQEADASSSRRWREVWQPLLGWQPLALVLHHALRAWLVSSGCIPADILRAPAPAEHTQPRFFSTCICRVCGRMCDCDSGLCCRGDSGGPVMEEQSQGAPVVVGINSWGDGNSCECWAVTVCRAQHAAAAHAQNISMDHANRAVGGGDTAMHLSATRERTSLTSFAAGPLLRCSRPYNTLNPYSTVLLLGTLF